MSMYAHIYVCVFSCCFPTAEHKTKTFMILCCNFAAIHGGDDQCSSTAKSFWLRHQRSPPDLITQLHLITLIKSYHLLHTPLPTKNNFEKKKFQNSEYFVFQQIMYLLA